MSDVDVDTFMNLVKKSVSEYLKAKEMESLGRKAMQGITIENGGNPVGRPAGTTLENRVGKKSGNSSLSHHHACRPARGGSVELQIMSFQIIIQTADKSFPRKDLFAYCPFE